MKNLYIGTADAFLVSSDISCFNCNLFVFQVVFAADDASSLEEALSTLSDIHARRGNSVCFFITAIIIHHLIFEGTCASGSQ